jgi:hypothetical protein
LVNGSSLLHHYKNNKKSIIKQCGLLATNECNITLKLKNQNLKPFATFI